LILFVVDLLHPVRSRSVQVFLNRDMRHGCGRRRTVPVLFAGREPDDISRPKLLDRPAPTLCPTAAGRYDESLAERVAVPCRPRARLERNAGAGDPCRPRRLAQGIDTNGAGKVLAR